MEPTSIIEELSDEDIRVLMRFISTLHGLRLSNLKVFISLRVEELNRKLERYLKELKSNVQAP